MKEGSSCLEMATISYTSQLLFDLLFLCRLKCYITCYFSLMLLACFILWKIFEKCFILLIAYLKELWNCILCIICVWSLSCSIQAYTSLHFLLILLGNYFVFIFCLSVLFALCWIWCTLHKHYNICIA